MAGVGLGWGLLAATCAECGWRAGLCHGDEVGERDEGVAPPQQIWHHVVQDIHGLQPLRSAVMDDDDASRESLRAVSPR